jgi:hypothetical protein
MLAVGAVFDQYSTLVVAIRRFASYAGFELRIPVASYHSNATRWRATFACSGPLRVKAASTARAAQHGERTQGGDDDDGNSEVDDSRNDRVGDPDNSRWEDNEPPPALRPSIKCSFLIKAQATSVHGLNPQDARVAPITITACTLTHSCGLRGEDARRRIHRAEDFTVDMKRWMLMHMRVSRSVQLTRSEFSKSFSVSLSDVRSSSFNNMWAELKAQCNYDCSSASFRNFLSSMMKRQEDGTFVRMFVDEKRGTSRCRCRLSRVHDSRFWLMGG